MLRQWVAERQGHEWIMVIIILGLILQGVVLFCIIRKLCRRTSQVHFQIDTPSRTILQCFVTLPDSTRCFNVDTKGVATKLVVTNYGLFGVIGFSTTPWTVAHSITGKKVSTPVHILVGPTRAKELKAALKGDPTIRCIIIHSHEFSYTRVHNERATSSAPPGYGNRTHLCECQCEW